MSQELNAARAELADADLELRKWLAIESPTPEEMGKVADALMRQSAAQLAVDEFQKTQSPMRKRVAYDSDAAIAMIAQQRWLIDQIIPVDAFGVIYGPSGAYKSFCAMDMSACIASAMNWHGNDVDEPGHVLYIGAEGASGLHLRKKAWEIRHQRPLTNLAILGMAVTINSDDHNALIGLCDELVQEIDQPIRLIVIDTLARSFQGEENSATDMGDFVNACDHIREVTGATILVVHHSGKDAEKGARGSSALRAACDFEFKVTSPGKKLTRLSCTKAKDSDPFDDINFKLNVVEIGVRDRKGKPLTSLILSPAAEGDIPTREDLSGSSQMINNLIAHEMARTGDDWVFYTPLRDSFFAKMGTDKRDSNTKMAWDRGIKKLLADEWIHKDLNGKITRAEVY
jgi:putative DNA primase/helicase|nr:MAG TPA: replicative DNA helicase [Caudoviricetes sp.]